MNNLFEKQTSWTDGDCYYVAALSGFRKAWLAGPYPTRGMAEDVLPRAVRWALRESGDELADRYEYRVLQHHHGHDRSILGEIQP
jgi:hypothetical protein